VLFALLRQAPKEESPSGSQTEGSIIVQQVSHHAESPTRHSELRRVGFAVLVALAFAGTLFGVSTASQAYHSEDYSDQSDHSSDNSDRSEDYSDHSEDYSR
jgi:hypothetical protein